MKALKSIGVIISLCFILCSCSSTKVVIGNYYIFGQDDQTFFDKSLPLTMAESEKGYYFFGGPNNNFLYYLDKASMKAVVLCNKPDCLHTDETNPEKIANCNACLFDKNTGLIYFNSSLYVLGDDNSLYQISLDGTTKKKVISFKELPHTIIIHRDFLYYTTDDHGTIEGNEANTVTDCKLYRIDMYRPDKGSELIYSCSGIYGQFIKVIGYEDSIYFSFVKYSDSKMQGMDSNLLKYDLKSQKITHMLDDIGNFSICDNKLLYLNVKSRKYNIMDLESSEDREVGYFNGHVTFDGRYIYCDTLPLKSQKRELIIYDLNGAEVNKFNLDFCGNDLIYGGDSNYLFIPDNLAHKNDYGEIKSLWVLDKSKIDLKNTELKKIYEYIPKAKFPGIITFAN
jgi:hypothetical protein